MREYLRIVTMVWACQFFVRAAIYFWVVRHYSLSETLIIRAVIGKMLFWGLLVGERLVRAPVFRTLVR